MDQKRVESALSPDFHSRGAYSGRVIQQETITVQDSEGNPIHVEKAIVISWDTIQSIMKLIKDRIDGK